MKTYDDTDACLLAYLPTRVCQIDLNPCKYSTVQPWYCKYLFMFLDVYTYIQNDEDMI